MFRIRRYEPGDAPKLYEAARESIDEVFRWLPWCHPDYSEAEAREWIETRGSMFDEDTEYQFMIVDEKNRCLGGCGLNHINRIHRFANLGYWVRTSATGGGVATAAVRQLEAFAWDRTDLVRLEIVCDVDNTASQRVAEKAGATHEGVHRDRLFLHDRPHDAVMFSLTRPRERT